MFGGKGRTAVPRACFRGLKWPKINLRRAGYNVSAGCVGLQSRGRSAGHASARIGPVQLELGPRFRKCASSVFALDRGLQKLDGFENHIGRLGAAEP
jgi:hypothetical protein